MIKMVFILMSTIIASIAFMISFSVADDVDNYFDETRDVDVANRGIKIRFRTENAAIKAAKKELKSSKLLRVEVNFLTYKKESQTLVHLHNNSKVQKWQSYVIQIVNHSEDKLYPYVFKLVGKKIIRLFPTKNERIVHGHNNLFVSGDKVAKFDEFSRNKVVFYFFFFKKRKITLEKKMKRNRLKIMYKITLKKTKLYASKLKERKKINQFKDKEFHPYNIWFKERLVRRVTIKRN